MPEHQKPLRATAMTSTRHGGKFIAPCQAGLSRSSLQYRLPAAKNAAYPTRISTEQFAAALIGGLHWHLVPERRRMETQNAWHQLQARVAKGASRH